MEQKAESMWARLKEMDDLQHTTFTAHLFGQLSLSEEGLESIEMALEYVERLTPTQLDLATDEEE